VTNDVENVDSSAVGGAVFAERDPQEAVCQVIHTERSESQSASLESS
jgi:hypothetical protein